MGCMGADCPYSNVPIMLCDKCKREIETGRMISDTILLCEDCFDSYLDDTYPELDVDDYKDCISIRCSQIMQEIAEHEQQRWGGF